MYSNSKFKRYKRIYSEKSLCQPVPATQLPFQRQVALLGFLVLLQRFYAYVSNFVHILPFSTKTGPVFCLIMHLVDYSVSVHNAYFLTFPFGCTVFFCMGVYISSVLLLMDIYFQSCGIKNSAVINDFVDTSLYTYIG